jgi:hypothetical protein
MSNERDLLIDKLVVEADLLRQTLKGLVRVHAKPACYALGDKWEETRDELLAEARKVLRRKIPRAMR